MKSPIAYVALLAAGCASAPKAPELLVVAEGYTVICTEQKQLESFIALQEKSERKPGGGAEGVVRLVQNGVRVTVDGCSAPELGFPYAARETADRRMLMVRPAGEVAGAWFFIWNNGAVRIISN